MAYARAIRQLAAITHFDLFVTATFDPYSHKLSATRNRRARSRSGFCILREASVGGCSR